VGQTTRVLPLERLELRRVGQLGKIPIVVNGCYKDGLTNQGIGILSFENCQVANIIETAQKLSHRLRAAQDRMDERAEQMAPQSLFGNRRSLFAPKALTFDWLPLSIRPEPLRQMRRQRGFSLRLTTVVPLLVGQTCSKEATLWTFICAERAC
jgi:hypothetical protein